MSWDDDDFEVPSVATSTQTFDDEVDEAENVLESWDSVPKPAGGAAPAASGEKKNFQKTSTKKKSGMKKLRKEEQEKRAAESSSPVLGEYSLSNEERAARQARVEAADLENAMEAFGINQDENEALFGGEEGEGAGEEQEGEQGSTLDTFKPKTERDFTRYGKMVAAKLTPYQESYHYTHLLKTVIRESANNVTPEDLKELSALVGVLINDKIKASSTKKKKGGKKKAPAAKSAAAYDDIVEDEYDMFA
ncbi:hypothetical protein QOT17_012069 [Balamuthia mandrillaris]